jgi:hypothetical protein
MEKKYSREIPNKVERMGGKFVLNYHLQETTEEEILSLWESEHYGMEEDYGQPDDYFKEEHKYNFNQVIVPMGKWKYDEVVSAIIRDKYREDEMEAITNNLAAVNAMFFQTLVNEGIVEAIKFLKDNANSEDTERFKEMQEWRALAKKEAREIFKI